MGGCGDEERKMEGVREGEGGRRKRERQGREGEGEGMAGEDREGERERERERKRVRQGRRKRERQGKKQGPWKKNKPRYMYPQVEMYNEHCTMDMYTHTSFTHMFMYMYILEYPCTVYTHNFPGPKANKFLVLQSLARSRHLPELMVELHW